MRWQKLITYTIPEAEKRIGSILLIVLLLPILSFSVFEFSRLNSNEQMIQEIYSNQLDAVLFSVNQYSNDILDQWSKGFNTIEQNEHVPLFFQQLMDFNPAIKEIILFNIPDTTKPFYSKSYSLTEEELLVDTTYNSSMYELVTSQKDKLQKQVAYIENKYQKIEVYPIAGGSLLPMVFALKNHIDNLQFVVLMVDAQVFIENVLAPKLQEISRDKFIMTSYVTKPVKRQTYFTDTLRLDEVALSRPLWLLPNHYLGIALKGNSIDKISKQRTRQNLYLLLMIDVFLIVVIYLVYRNIKKEIVLTRIKAEFVSNVSHEIRTPLAMISMFAETLLAGRVKQEEKKTKYYKMITEEAQRLNHTVNKILNFSKIESGKQIFDFEVTDIQLLTERCLQSHQRQLSINNFKVDFNKTSQLSMINADKEALSEAINNLIDNAVKYSKEKKEIVITAFEKGKHVTLTFQDFGIGIPLEYQKDIFNKFYRVPNNDVHDTKGTGLGLTMVKHIVEAHQGSIELNSTINMGTVFKLRFPAIKSS
jgi:two-component system phosphate regulon sensor histidine kinase PhoR